MTDDSEPQRQALAAIWPEAQQLLCTFHVLQGFWTWLHEGKNRINKDHCQVLMYMLNQKQVSTASTKNLHLIQQQFCTPSFCSISTTTGYGDRSGQFAFKKN